MTSMPRFSFAVLALSMVVAVSSLSGGEPEAVAVVAAPEVPQKDMLTEMREEVQAIATKHGNPPFLQIFSNDPKRAELLRARLKAVAQTDKAESLGQQIAEKTKQLAALEIEIGTKQALLAQIERSLQAAQMAEAAAAAAAPGATTK